MAIFAIFILSAIVTVIAATKLSTYADELSVKTSLGGMLIGTILLAGATSLPEVTTSLSAIAINNPDIAVGNVFGSNLFNLFILAAVDIVYRKRQMLIGANKEHFYTASIGFLLAIVTFISLKLKLNITIFNVGIESIIIVVIYIAGVLFLSKLSSNEENLKRLDEPVVKKQLSEDDRRAIRRTIVSFGLAAIVILITGTALSITGDKIATITGLSSSFVGSFLIAATTSLPEAVSVLIAVRLRNYNLAIGAVLGSNMFNMLILSGSDLFYRNGAILANVSNSHLVTVSAVTFLSIFILYPLARKNERSTFAYILPSLLLIVAYFLSTYLIFTGV